ncbi:hypothetical protein [Nonomuraea zeae]|uniref:hypothetical protein n=1 Tax=Nonomuraea zeae TaxID=1642303 RepID=UPI003605FF65
MTKELSQCWLCQGPVISDADEEIDIIVIDPETGWPPDYNPATGEYDRQITEDMLERCTREAVCPSCQQKITVNADSA